MNQGTNHRIAEFHDIGKIVDWKAMGLQACDTTGNPVEKEPHDFQKCTEPEWAIDFSTPVWESVFRKNSEIVQRHYPHSINWVLVSLADELAAGLGRVRDEAVAGHPQYGHYCLWTGKQQSDPRLKAVSELKGLIQYLNQNPSWDQVAQRYSQLLHSRAETARPGLNVTTLYSHSVLSGKLFRVLGAVLATSRQSFPSYGDALKAFESSKLTIVFVRVLFPQRPFRVRDLSIFRQREDAIREVLARFESNVLIHYGENILALFLCRNDAHAFTQYILGLGYLGLVRTGEKSLAEMRSIGIEKALGKEEWSSATLPDEIHPPLCEGCQMGHGDRRWPADFIAQREDLTPQGRAYLLGRPWRALRAEELSENDRANLAEWLEERVEENLCSHCFDLRSRAEPLTKLAAWQSGTVAWARMALNLESLIEALRRLNVAYLKAVAKQIQPNLLSTLPVRFPLLADFVEDYQKFLDRWRACVIKAFGQDMVEQVNEDMLCVRLAERREVLRLLEIHCEMMVECFPKIVDLGVSPVRFAISISPVKYPFFVHWRYLETPQVGVGVQVVGGGTAEIPQSRLGDILQTIGRGDRRALHRLRQIARTSKALAELVLSDRQDRDSRAFVQLKQMLPLGMDFESLVTLANLAER